MSERRELTKYQGVYQRRSDSKRNPIDGKIDVCYYITYKDKNRKKVWETIGWKSKGFSAQYARDILGERIQQLRFGEVIAERNNKETSVCLTFGDAWKLYSEKWLPNLSRPDDEHGRYVLHIAPRFAETPLDQIKAFDLECFKQELFDKGLSPASIKHILGNIRRVYNKLNEWELYDGRIPTASIKMPKVDNARVRYLTPDEAALLLGTLKKRSLTWWRISLLSLNTGMRLGEILSLTVADIDYNSNVIQVRYAKTGTRIVQMNQAAKTILVNTPITSPAGLIFPSKMGELIKITDASKTFSRVVKDLGLNPKGIDESQKVVFHTLRHTFASWLAISGEPLYTISKLMGHKTITMTQRYAHLCPDVKKEAVGKIDTIMNQLLSCAF